MAERIPRIILRRERLAVRLGRKLIDAINMALSTETPESLRRNKHIRAMVRAWQRWRDTANPEWVDLFNEHLAACRFEKQLPQLLFAFDNRRRLQKAARACNAARRARHAQYAEEWRNVEARLRAAGVIPKVDLIAEEIAEKFGIKPRTAYRHKPDRKRHKKSTDKR
jgi:hypothetical protein